MKLWENMTIEERGVFLDDTLKISTESIDNIDYVAFLQDMIAIYNSEDEGLRQFLIETHWHGQLEGARRFLNKE